MSSEAIYTEDFYNSVYKIKQILPSVKFKPTYLYIKRHTITGKLYFGKTIHNPIKYKGSGSHWMPHIKLHGVNNVETLWFCEFHSKEDIVDFALSFSFTQDIVKSTDWLNLIPETGIDIHLNDRCILAKDADGIPHQVYPDDPRLSSKELVGISAGMTTVINRLGETMQVKVDDHRLLSGEIHGIAKDKYCVVDKNGSKFLVDRGDSRVASGEVHSINIGKIAVKDNLGNNIQIDKDDIRYATGQIFGVNKGKVTVKDVNGITFQTTIDDPKYISGELVSASLGVRLSESAKHKLKISMTGISRGMKNDYIAISPSGVIYTNIRLCEFIKEHCLNKEIIKRYVNRGKIPPPSRKTTESRNLMSGWEFLRSPKQPQ